MNSLLFRWLCLLSLSLPLLLWFGHVVTRDDISPVAHSTGSGGYTRIVYGMTDQFLDMHCTQCAFVSSSGQMLGTGAGEEIDKFQCVIRMNNAPIKGYEKDVGRRTSVRVVSHTSVPLLVKNEHYFFKQSAGTIYVFWGPDKHMRQDGKGRTFNTLRKMATKYPNVRIYAMTKERIEYCDKMFQNETGKNSCGFKYGFKDRKCFSLRMKTGAYLSTGFFTMVLAVDMCDSIHVYGMIDGNYCSRGNHSVVPYHYYEKNRINECRMYKVHEHAKRGGHRFMTEKVIYAKWATHHKMKFKHPSWSL